MTLYKVWDAQLDSWAFDGATFNTRDRAIYQMLDYFSYDCDKSEMQIIEQELDSTGEWADLRIKEVEA